MPIRNCAGAHIVVMFPRSGPRTDKMAAAAWPAFPAMNRFGQELADTLRSA
jgi:hypothetical protein